MNRQLNHPAWSRARPRRVVAVAAAMALLLPGSILAQDVPEVALRGPNGARTGTEVPVDQGPPDPTGLEPLDTYGRDPRLRIWSADPDLAFSAWQIQAAPIDDPDTGSIDLGSGIAEVPLEIVPVAPPPVGDWLVTAVLTNGADATDVTAWAWRVIVPDRTIPPAIPVPDLVLFGSSGTVVAERGSSCFLATCGDIGRIPPPDRLPLLRLGLPDEPITVTLSDGRGIARLWVTAVPLATDARGDDAVTLLQLAAIDPVATVVQVPPPGPGRWRLDVVAGLADARGELTGYARVVVPEG